MEVVIIMVVFNTFMTKEAEGAGLCGVWAAGSAEHGVAGVCSPAQMAKCLCPPCLPVSGVRPEWSCVVGVEEPSGIFGVC